MTRRIAGAPITWGVCEVPGWGHQLSPDRVLSEMADLGLEATELGPDGFLPTDPAELRELLASHGLTLVGGFIPVVLHDRTAWADTRPDVERRLTTLAAGGGEVAVVAAATGRHGYEGSIALTADEWATLAETVADLAEMARERGVRAAIHPHHGTAITGPDSIERLLDISDIDLCLDTGHILVGGGDPVALAKAAPSRVAHVHLKDVDAGLAAKVRSNELGYHAAVAAGMYRPLGEGDVDLASIIGSVEDAGFAGWYVLEQDVVLTAAPAPRTGPYEAAASSRRFLARFPPPKTAERTGASAPSIGKEGRT